jgi:hypothetical protein
LSTHALGYPLVTFVQPEGLISRLMARGRPDGTVIGSQDGGEGAQAGY